MTTKSTVTQDGSEIETEVFPLMADTKESETDSSAAESGIEHMIPGVIYFDIIDPDTGSFINPVNPKYFSLKRQFGGDAGTVDPYKSAVCAPVIEEWRKRQAPKH